jgi:hypothetical protein
MKVNTRKHKSRIRQHSGSPLVNDDLPALKIKKKASFAFVLDELSALGVRAKPMFGFVYVYLGEKLIMLLRERENQPERNGVWLATTSEYLESLSREFPLLPRICVIDTGRNGWVFLPFKLQVFESYAFRACELVSEGDPRVGQNGNSASARARTRKALAFVPAHGNGSNGVNEGDGRQDIGDNVS